MPSTPVVLAQGATPELYLSTRAIIGRLGIEVVELTAAACCGAGVVTEADPDMALAINARTFAQAEALGLDVMTICGTCQGVMSAANRRLKTETGTPGSYQCSPGAGRSGLPRSCPGQASLVDRGTRTLGWLALGDVGLRTDARLPHRPVLRLLHPASVVGAGI